MSKAPIVLSQSSIYQMKIVLDGIKPPIWRRLLVAGDTKLGKLHQVLQVVMGWEDAHMHEFRAGKVSFGEPSPDYLGKGLHAKKAELRDVAQNAKDRFKYIYDFGDGWEHDLIVEKIVDPETGKHYPVCLAGERACLPRCIQSGPAGGLRGNRRILNAAESSLRTEDRR